MPFFDIDKPKEYKFKDYILFGQYKGCKIEDIFHDDPKYLSWLFDNVKKFRMSKKDTKRVQDRMSELIAEDISRASKRARRNVGFYPDQEDMYMDEYDYIGHYPGDS